MTTVQETSNGHCVSPPPCSVQDSAKLNRAGLPTDKANNIPYPSYASAIDTTVLPDRCQFFFSDGRQCTMGRSEIHPSLCTYHSDREEQLFGNPHQFSVASRMDLPELYSACRDLTTAAGVNRALGQVFRLLALRRISRQEAATFCHLAQLLLRSISAASNEKQTSRPGSIHDHLNSNPSHHGQIAAPASSESPRTVSDPPPKIEDVTTGSAGATPGQRKAAPSASPDFASALSRSRTALAASAPHSQVPQNQHLRKIRRQPTQNEHIPKCAT
jgi:hypothetical protein